MLELIPLERQAAVSEALQATFTHVKVDAIHLLHGGGSSSLTYKIIVTQKAYVLRVMGLDQPINNRDTQISCLIRAAALNIAPQCYYANAEHGIIIMGHIHAQPIIDRMRLLTELAGILHNLHQTKDFPPAHMQIFDYLPDLAAELKQYPLPDFLINYFAQITEIQKILTPHLTRAACHNDLNFQNILFDGTKLWLIDWEAAGKEDPFFDLATVCNQLCCNEAMENLFLINYFGQTITSFQQAKLYLMQQVAHYYYALHFLIHALHGGISIMDCIAPDLFSWNIGYINGTYQLANPSDFLLYGIVQVKSSLAKINANAFTNAKAIIATSLN